MAKEAQIKAHEISTGVSYDSFLKKSQEIFNNVVRPQVEAESQLTDDEKEIKLTSEEKAYANCHSPY